MEGPAPSFHGSPRSARKAHLSGSLLAAALARSWGRRCTAGWPSPKQPLPLSGPQLKTRGGPVGAKSREWVWGGVLTRTRAQRRSRPPGLTPAYISTLYFCFPTKAKIPKVRREQGGGGGGGNLPALQGE